MSSRLSLTLLHWPPPDRSARDRALASDDDLFGEGGAVDERRPATWRNYFYTYGQWLAFLIRIGELVQTDQPADRVTRHRMERWVAAMRERRLTPTALRQTLANFHAALRLMAPDADLRWIIRPQGLPLRKAIRGNPKPFVARDTGEVLANVRLLHRQGLADPTSPEGRQALRDAALFGLLLTRAPRVGSLVTMTMDEHLRQDAEGRWQIRFPAEHTKGKQCLDYDLDAECSAMLSDYLGLARPFFPGAGQTDRLWMGMKGPMTIEGLKQIFRRRTFAWLGKAYGPHAARKWLRTTAARRSPGLALDASEILGHSPEVSIAHYAEANNLHAGLRHGDHLRKLRRKTAGIAERAYVATFASMDEV